MQDPSRVAPAKNDWPAPVETVNEGGASAIVLLCDHASRHIPAAYHGLQLGAEHRASHIAWDIGAADVTRRLAVLLDAPAFLGTYSRLLIDLNRPPGAVGSIPQRSEATDIPGNAGLTAEEKLRRRQRIFEPFQSAVARFLDSRDAAGRPTILVAIHSFTPTFLGHRRPWHAGVLFGRAASLGERLVRRLGAEPALTVAANEPYSVNPAEDYAILVHGDDRGIPAVLIEIRNDGIADPSQVETWARRLAQALRPEASTAGCGT